MAGAGTINSSQDADLSARHDAANSTTPTADRTYASLTRGPRAHILGSPLASLRARSAHGVDAARVATPPPQPPPGFACRFVMVPVRDGVQLQHEHLRAARATIRRCRS